MHQWVPNQPMPEGYSSDCSHKRRSKPFSVIRYADDLVSLHPSQELLHEMQPVMKEWLANTSGLTLNEKKTKIVSSPMDSHFLALQSSWCEEHRPKDKPLLETVICVINNTPAERHRSLCVNLLEKFVKNIRLSLRTTLIQKLRPSIFGWANYYRHSECSQVFSRLQYLIWQKLRAWVFTRSPKQSRGEIRHTYFPVGRSYL